MWPLFLASADDDESGDYGRSTTAQPVDDVRNDGPG
jgi:hypothetical protein